MNNNLKPKGLKMDKWKKNKKMAKLLHKLFL